MYWHHQRGVPWTGREELMRAMDSDAVTKNYSQPQPYAGPPRFPTINFHIRIPAYNIIPNQPPQLQNNIQNAPVHTNLWRAPNNPWPVPPWPAPINPWQAQMYFHNIQVYRMQQMQMQNLAIMQNRFQNPIPVDQTPNAQDQVNVENPHTPGDSQNATLPQTPNPHIQQMQPGFGVHNPQMQSHIQPPYTRQPAQQIPLRGRFPPPIQFQYRQMTPVTSAQVVKSGGQLSQSQQGMYQNVMYWYPTSSYNSIQQPIYDRPMDEPSHEPLKDKTVAVPPALKQNKKKPTPTWKNKTNSFSHQYLTTSLMGHSGKITHLDCTADAKYLVTCADDERPADYLDGGSSSGSEASKENRSPSESPTGSSPGSPSGSRRSARRRRKPRPIREQRTSDSVSPPPPPPALYPLPRFAQMKLSDHDLANLMSRYLLNNLQLSSLGYPIEDPEDPTRAIIIATDFPTPARQFDVNAREFVPRRKGDSQIKDYDSGRGSGSSSPRSGSSSPRSTDSDPEEDERLHGIERKCARCAQGFLITQDGVYITKERCSYHYGRIKRDAHTFLPIEWGCCGAAPNDPGCSKASVHVWSGTSAGVNGPLEGYVRTRPRIPGAPRHAVLAVDCEMVYTAAGLQVAQVEVVGADGRRIYSTYVRPDAQVVDHNTRYSGISARHMQKATKTLQGVQRELLNIIDADTILVGHGLENDLRALRLLHSRVVDTAVSFAHPRGLPFRMSLKHLANVHLQMEVQQRHHSPVEDARVSLELMLVLIQNDFGFANQR